MPLLPIIDSRSLEVAFQDKKRTIAGEDRYLIPDGLLQCSMEASSKEVIDEITTIVEEVAEEYGANATVALTRAKAYVSEAAEEGRGVVPHELAAEVFEDEPLQERFVETAAEENIPERVRVDKRLLSVLPVITRFEPILASKSRFRPNMLTIQSSLNLLACLMA